MSCESRGPSAVVGRYLGLLICRRKDKFGSEIFACLPAHGGVGASFRSQQVGCIARLQSISHNTDLSPWHNIVWLAFETTVGTSRAERNKVVFGHHDGLKGGANLSPKERDLPRRSISVYLIPVSIILQLHIALALHPNNSGIITQSRIESTQYLAPCAPSRPSSVLSGLDLATS